MALSDTSSPLDNVPVIDLSQTNDELLVKQIASACMEPGFFQVIHHDIPQALLDSFREQCQLYFSSSREMKVASKRNAGNARGYFDDELTKQKRDWKECLDVGAPGSRDWDLPDDAPENACLDGFNQFPSEESLPDYRRVTVEYFEACAALSHRLTVLMARGLGKDSDDPFLLNLKEKHTSYLRTNYYPPCREPQE
jgi:isopenicillin N synthase-like dioxygenase